MWYESWKQSRGTDAPPATWKGFKDAFLDRYLPLEIREARADQFINVHQRGMSLREYILKFNSLAIYDRNVEATMEDRIHLYVDRLELYFIRDFMIDSLNKDIYIAKMHVFAQKMEDQR